MRSQKPRLNWPAFGDTSHKVEHKCFTMKNVVFTPAKSFFLINEWMNHHHQRIVWTKNSWLFSSLINPGPVPPPAPEQKGSQHLPWKLLASAVWASEKCRGIFFRWQKSIGLPWSLCLATQRLQHFRTKITQKCHKQALLDHHVMLKGHKQTKKKVDASL